MAKRKEEVEEGLFDIGADELDEVLAGLPSDDSVINLYRVNPNGRAAYVCEFAPTEFSLEAVRNTYGGGKYKYVAKSGSSVRRGTFEVDGAPRTGGNPKVGYKRYNEQGKLVFTRPDDPEALAYGARNELINKSGDVSLVLLLDEIRRLRDEVKQPAQAQSPEAIKKGFLDEMAIFKQLFVDDKKSPTEDFSKMAIDLIKQGMEVAANMENGSSPWMLLLDKVLPTVQDAIKAYDRQQQRANVQGRVQRTGVQGQEVGEVQGPDEMGAIPPPGFVRPNVPMTGFASIADKLRAYLPTFLSAASANTDPSILIDLTCPQVPEKEKATVIEWLESETWFSDLCTLHPLIQGQQAWWDEYRAGLLESLRGTGQVEMEQEVQ